MNTLSIIIISVLVVSFALYFYFSRKLIRELIESIKYSKQVFDATQKDYHTLNEQYRQLAKINEALRSISQVKNSKKK
jgi:predicted PurR-regulated permease PerM